MFGWNESMQKLPEGFNAHIDSNHFKWNVIYKKRSGNEYQTIETMLTENQAKIMAHNLNIAKSKKTRIKQ